MNEVTQADLEKAFPRLGTVIRTARKEGRCQYGRRYTGGPVCEERIKPGDKYVAGACNFAAGPWSRDRYCMGCVRSRINLEDWLDKLPNVA